MSNAEMGGEIDLLYEHHPDWQEFNEYIQGQVKTKTDLSNLLALTRQAHFKENSSREKTLVDDLKAKEKGKFGGDRVYLDHAIFILNRDGENMKNEIEVDSDAEKDKAQEYMKIVAEDKSNMTPTDIDQLMSSQSSKGSSSGN
jgi:hypothetical protein